MRAMKFYAIEISFDSSFSNIIKYLNRCLDFVLLHFPAQGLPLLKSSARAFDALVLMTALFGTNSGSALLTA